MHVFIVLNFHVQNIFKTDFFFFSFHTHFLRFALFKKAVTSKLAVKKRKKQFFVLEKVNSRWNQGKINLSRRKVMVQ